MTSIIHTILWDVDGTLLDFESSEEISIRICLEQQNASCTDEELALYKDINRRYWNMLENKQITKEELYPARFAEWFKAIGKEELDPARMNDDYQEALGNTPYLYPDTIDVLKELRKDFRQYVVTNGSRTAQYNKLAKSGIGELMDGIFISEEIGIPKPDPRFFSYCAANISGYDPSTTVIIGDSLNSDMRGGNQAGILCIWFNPNKEALPSDIRIGHCVTSLSKIPNLLRSL